MSTSHRKSAQVHVSPGQKESQVDPSSQLAATCDSVWPGLKFEKLVKYVNERTVDDIDSLKMTSDI